MAKRVGLNLRQCALQPADCLFRRQPTAVQILNFTMVRRYRDWMVVACHESIHSLRSYTDSALGTADHNLAAGTQMPRNTPDTKLCAKTPK